MVMAPTACIPAEICMTKHSQDKSDLDYNHNLSQISNNGGDDLSQSRLAAKDLVMDVLKKRADEVNTDRCAPGDEDAFYVADMGEVYRQHLRWKMNLSRVRPFYGRFARVWSLNVQG